MNVGQRLWQPKSFSLWNQSRNWSSYEDMFQHDLDRNITATASGWGVENLHLLAALVQLAVSQYTEGIRPPHSLAQRKDGYESQADRLISEGSAVTGDDLMAHFDSALMNHHAMVTAHRAGALVQDPNALFVEHIARFRDMPCAGSNTSLRCCMVSFCTVVWRKSRCTLYRHACLLCPRYHSLIALGAASLHCRTHRKNCTVGPRRGRTTVKLFWD